MNLDTRGILRRIGIALIIITGLIGYQYRDHIGDLFNMYGGLVGILYTIGAIVGFVFAVLPQKNKEKSKQ